MVIKNELPEYNFLDTLKDIKDICNGKKPRSWNKPKPKIKSHEEILNEQSLKLLNILTGRVGESFRDNVLRSKVRPLEGCIVYCRLARQVEHSGIYIGNGYIVHLDGNGNIELVRPKKFLERLDGWNPSMSIYISCVGTDPIRSRKIANRAKDRIGRNNGYDLFSNNCHRFTSSCITGDLDNKDVTFTRLKNTANKVLSIDQWRVWDFPYKK